MTVLHWPGVIGVGVILFWDQQIDWSQSYTFLDQELQAVTRDAELGKRFVDKLVQVHRLSGKEDWIYIHLEIQGSEHSGAG